MSKSNVVPSVPSAKVLSRFQHYFENFPKLTPDALNPEAKAMLLESARIHDENEDRADQLSAKALDELSPHARAALDRLLGKAHDPE
jgi:hypothetical protein